MKYKKILFVLCLPLMFLLFPLFCQAMEPGTLLYRTTDNGKMFGYSSNELIESKLGIMTGINPGHVAIYVGQEDGVDYVVEALAGGIVKSRLDQFINEARGEKFVGAKIPKNLSNIQQARAVALAKILARANLAYDLDLKKQKGPASGEWTCVGLTEKIYESANIANPGNISDLEYDVNSYAVDITPDGYDNSSFYNINGDCFSSTKEFSMISPKTDIVIPLPEKYGFNAGLIYNNERYIFLPYTQFLQESLRDVVVDKKISSSFNDSDVRANAKVSTILLRWSLVNNPVSAIKIAASNVKDSVSSIYQKSKEAVVKITDNLFKKSDDDKLLVLETKDTEIVKTKPTLIGHNEVLPVVSRIASANVNDYLNKDELAGDKTVEEVKEVLNNDKQERMDNVKLAISDILPYIVSSTSSAYLSEKIEQANNQANTRMLNNESDIEVNNSNFNEVAETELDVLVNRETATESIKISKVYATEDNDFIELYNPNNFSINLADNNYRLEKAKTAINPGIMMRIGNETDGSYPGGTVIAAGGYYLIVKDSASDFYLSKADAIATRSEFNLSGLNQTIYLGTGAISSYQDEDIVDLVGFGPGATYYLGSAPASQINNYHFLNRISYNKDNKVDYNLLLSPEPAAILAWQQENSSASEISEEEQEEQQEQQEQEDEQEEQEDEEQEDNVDTNKLNAVSSLLLIGEIGVYENDDYIRLINYSDYDIDLAEYNIRLEKSKTTEDPLILIRIGNSEDASYPGGTIISAQSSYLIVRDDAASRLLTEADAIVNREDFNLMPSGYSIYLAKGPVSSPQDEDIIDLLGYGESSLYYYGSLPAPAIINGYLLRRIQNTDNNYLDFELLRDENYEIDSEEVSSEDTGLFIFPEPQYSDSIINLWHFDDCYEDIGGKAIVGKWACGRQLSTNNKLELELSARPHLNSMTLGFFYKTTGNNSSIIFKLTNDNEDSLSIKVDNGYLQVAGIPGGDVFYPEVSIDENWRYFTIVINQLHDYWAVYIDGEEIVKKYFLGKLTEMKYLSFYGDGLGINIDEMSIWSQPLSQDEIRGIINMDAPFSPVDIRANQQKAVLLHHWNFEEYGEGSSQDIIAQQSMNIPISSWTGRNTNNYALKVSSVEDYEVDFDEAFSYQDLSLSFWWRNNIYPDDGNAIIKLLKKEEGEEIEQFSLTTSYFRKLYGLNSTTGILSEGINNTIPYDNKWHHLALVYDSYRYSLDFYVDGERQTSTYLVRFKDGAERVDSLKIYSNSYESTIDDLMIFGGALQASEVKSIYNSTKVDDWEHY